MPRWSWSRMAAFAVLIFATLVGTSAAGGQQGGLANPGFETGDLSGWVRSNNQFEAISVVGAHKVPSVLYGAADVDIAPREGTKMAQLARPDWSQYGFSMLQQDFTIAGPVIDFAYNFCSYDHVPQDYFEARLSVAGEASPRYQVVRTAPEGKTGYELWCTGWQDVVVTVPVEVVGQTARLFVAAGGTVNDSLASWAYLDTMPRVSQVVAATVDVKPDTLQARSDDKGNAPVTAYLELPAGLSVSAVNPASVTLEVQGVTFAPVAPVVVGDYDLDGVPDAAFVFARAPISATLVGAGTEASVTLRGTLSSGESFVAADTVKVVAHDASAGFATPRRK